jgi:CubicO group peptidase (beta-lactamase class C family)
MTAADLATYGKALAAGELFQNPDTLNEMLTFDPAALPSLNAPYGLGLFDAAGDGSVWGHGGQTLGFQSLWFTDPENGIIVVGLTNSAVYNATGLVNVRNILAGNGPLPVSSSTLLPAAAPTAWHWTQFVTPVEAIEIDEPDNFQILLTAEQGVLFINPDCGTAVGTYTNPVNKWRKIGQKRRYAQCDADVQSK